MNSYAQIKAIEEHNKNRWLRLNPKLSERSGIYILYREQDEIKYAYVGQAKHLLTRLAQHLVGYQHIDLSLKKYGLYSAENPCGWQVHFIVCPLDKLDETEREWIKHMANKGYQLRNHTLGGQDSGKSGLDVQKSSRGYREGVAQGRRTLAKELLHIISTHLIVDVKKHNKVTAKALDKFWSLLKLEDIESEEQE